MKNKKKFKKELYNILSNGNILALDPDGKPISCRDIDCHQCKFFTGIGCCSIRRKIWLESDYVEPEIDWSNVPIDTKVLVKDFDNCEWIPRYFAGVDKNGHPLAWRGGCTSFTVNSNNDNGIDIHCFTWGYMKLYKEDKKDED